MNRSVVMNDTEKKKNEKGMYVASKEEGKDGGRKRDSAKKKRRRIKFALTARRLVEGGFLSHALESLEYLYFLAPSVTFTGITIVFFPMFDSR